jgi:hypothetical protein
MPAPEHEKRSYKQPDSELLTRSSAMQLAFVARQADFVAHDPMFGGSYGTDWSTAISACYAFESDEAMLDLLQSRTQAVDEACGQAHTALTDLRYFAQKAFGSSGYYKAFQFGAHNKVRQSAPAYVLYLRTQHALALQLAPQLTAKGMTPAHMAALQTAADQLAATDLAQELHKRQRILATAQRLALFTALYSIAQQVNAAAEVIYADDAANRGVFALR